MEKAVSDSIEMQLRSAFPEGTFTRVDVLTYGDDPDVEPGEAAVRAFVDRAGQPAGSWQDDEKVLQAFEEPNRAAIKKLGHDTAALPPVAWVQFIPDTPARRAPDAVLWGFPSMLLGMRSDVADDAPGFASVRAQLGPADLATVDTLITAGIASTRAEAIRWMVGRIRENPAYGQIQQRVREIGELKDQL
jgi:hypothetical protein